MIRTISILTLFSVTLFFSCKKKDAIEPNPHSTSTSDFHTKPTGNTTTDTNVNFISATIDLLDWKATNGFNACQLINNSVKHTEYTSEVVVDYQPFLQQSTGSADLLFPLQGTIKINFRKFRYNLADYTNIPGVFYSTFDAGNRTYYDTLQPNKSGVEIQYIDASGVEWSTIYGSQSNSSFSILWSRSDADMYMKASKTVKGKFSCQVYRKGHPETAKVITLGQYLLNITKP